MILENRQDAYEAELKRILGIIQGSVDKAEPITSDTLSTLSQLAQETMSVADATALQVASAEYCMAANRDANYALAGRKFMKTAALNSRARAVVGRARFNLVTEQQ